MVGEGLEASFFFVTGTIFNFDANKPKRIRRLKYEIFESAERALDKLYSGTLWVVYKGSWFVIKRKPKL